jgi:hypothetical protein
MQDGVESKTETWPEAPITGTQKAARMSGLVVCAAHQAATNTKLTIRAAKDLSRVPTKADIVGRSHPDANELPRWIESLLRHDCVMQLRLFFRKLHSKH